MRHYLDLDVTVQIDIADGADPFSRITGPEGDEWRSYYCDLRTEDDVLEYFAYNCAHNGINDASRLDGWADMEPGQVTMYVD